MAEADRKEEITSELRRGKNVKFIAVAVKMRKSGYGSFALRERLVSS